MNEPAAGREERFDRIRRQAVAEQVRVKQHAQAEMVEEAISLDDVREAIAAGRILEDYPEHRRGPCCLVGGFTASGRPLHVVCTTGQDLLILITVYEPSLPKWVTPFQRRSQ